MVAMGAPGGGGRVGRVTPCAPFGTDGTAFLLSAFCSLLWAPAPASAANLLPYFASTERRSAAAGVFMPPPSGLSHWLLKYWPPLSPVSGPPTISNSTERIGPPSSELSMSQNGSAPSQPNTALSVSVVLVWIVPSAFTSTSVCLKVNPLSTITHGTAPQSEPVDAS